MTFRCHSWKDGGSVQVPADMKRGQKKVLHSWQCTRCGCIQVCENKPPRNLLQYVKGVAYNCAESVTHEVHSS